MYCLTSSADRSVKLWNPATNTCIKTYTGHGKAVLDVKLYDFFSLFAFRFSLFLFFSSFFFDHNSMDEISNFFLWQFYRPMTDNARFVSCSGDRQVFVWDVATGKTVQRYTPTSTTHQFPNDPTLFYLFFLLFSLLNWLRRYSDHTQRVNSIGLNPDGTVVVSASYDSTIKLWDCRSLSKRPIQTLTDAKDSVESVSIQDYEIISG